MSAISRFLSFWDIALFDPITMTAITAATAIAGAGASLYGASVAAAGDKAAGANALALGQFQQAELTEQGEQDTAYAQAKMIEQQRQGKLIQSKLQANAAASGASATGDSTLKLSSDLAGRTEYESLMSLNVGESQQTGLTNQGDAALYQGQLSKSMAPTAAAGAWATGIGGAFSNLSRVNPAGFGFGGGGGGVSGAPTAASYGPDRPSDWG